MKHYMCKALEEADGSVPPDLFREALYNSYIFEKSSLGEEEEK